MTPEAGGRRTEGRGRRSETGDSESAFRPPPSVLCPPPSALRPLILAGPTAVGKSAIALCLAEMLNGEIISVDSMQVY